MTASPQQRPRSTDDVAGVEEQVRRVAALVLEAHALAERYARTPATDDSAAERLAALRWAECAGCREIERIATDGHCPTDDGGPGSRWHVVDR